jgi:hypothetical protein
MDLAVISACFYKTPDSVAPFLRSCKAHSISPVLYGVGQKFPGFVAGKVHRLREELLKLDNKYVAYVDSGDSLFRHSLEVLWSRYKKVSPSRNIVMAGDKRCWPHKIFMDIFDNRYGKKKLQPYMCAGFFMGPRKALLHALKVVSGLYATRYRLLTKMREDDQGYWMESLGRGYIDIDIDCDGRLSLTMARQSKDAPANVDPVIIHYNAESKELMPDE